MSLSGRLLVVSNRLPFSVVEDEKGLHIERSSGGLVSALIPLFREMKGGCWIGWPGTDQSKEVVKAIQEQPAGDYSIQPVYLTQEEKTCFYHGCANEIIWPLFHDLQSKCNFNPSYWVAYRRANEKFAISVANVARRDDFIWVHDYHLMLLGKALRVRGFQNEIAYFHHIPFPPPDIFEKLPWRMEILQALLQFDNVGLQTDRDRRNFLASVRRLLPGTHIRKTPYGNVIEADGIRTRVGTFAIGIDFHEFSQPPDQRQVELKMREVKSGMSGRQLILGVDRLDYTKGILERLIALRSLFRSHPELLGRVTMLQVAVPSREEIPDYHALRERLENLIREINEEFSLPGWTPVIYRYESISRTELLALYRTADVALITPLKDGMNLVAKEFCAARTDNCGVLVLSEFAGAAEELGIGAVLVNPYDSEGVAFALCQSLRMSKGEQIERMQPMRSLIAKNDVFNWCRAICFANMLVFSPAPQFDNYRAFNLGEQQIA